VSADQTTSRRISGGHSLNIHHEFPTFVRENLVELVETQMASADELNASQLEQSSSFTTSAGLGAIYCSG